MATIASAEDYARHFNPERYLKLMYDDPDGQCYSFIIRTLHSIFSKGEIQGQKLLDIGTGPSIHNVISASSCVEEVYLSDFAEQNLKVLWSWLSGERDLQNQFVRKVCELENKTNHIITSKCINERVGLLRQKVKKVFQIDVTNLESLNKMDVPITYDVITSSWCLDYAVGGIKEIYIRCVKNIFNLLKPGGVLVLIGDLNGVVFNIEGVNYPAVNVTKEELCYIYRNEGFDIKQLNQICTKNDICAADNPDKEVVTFVMVAKKKKNYYYL